MFWDNVIFIIVLVCLVWIGLKNYPWDISFNRHPEDKKDKEDKCECPNKENCPFKEFLD